MGLGTKFSQATGGYVSPSSFNQAGQWGVSPYYGQGMMGLNMMGISSPFSPPPQPGAPDFESMAREQYDLTMQGARPNQYTPFGSSVWTQGPEGDWSQQVSFSPEQQRLFEAGQAGQEQLLGSEMPTFGGRREQVMEAMMARGSGDIGRAREQKHSQLIAQGIPPGSQAYETEMDRFSRQEVDLRQQAELGSTQMAGQEYGAELAGRGQRAAELGRFTPGMPQMPSFQQVQGPDLFGAGMARGEWDLAGWNAEQQRQNAIMQGLFGLGAAGVGAR